MLNMTTYCNKAHSKMEKKFKFWFIIPTRKSTLSRYYEMHLCALARKRKRIKKLKSISSTVRTKSTAPNTRNTSLLSDKQVETEYTKATQP
jgi:hypothetical protein